MASAAVAASQAAVDQASLAAVDTCYTYPGVVAAAAAASSFLVVDSCRVASDRAFEPAAVRSRTSSAVGACTGADWERRHPQSPAASCWGVVAGIEPAVGSFHTLASVRCSSSCPAERLVEFDQAAAEVAFAEVAFAEVAFAEVAFVEVAFAEVASVEVASAVVVSSNK